MVSSDTVLGLGGTVDYEIEWDSSVLEALAVDYGVTVAELTTARPIASERDLLVSVLAFLQTGSGGERFVASSGIVETFASRFASRVTLGGTGVRAALAMEVLGVTSTLHLVSIDDHVRRLLPRGSGWISSAERDTTDPHLIIQFPVGATVRIGDVALTASHANRLIYSNDPPNQTLFLSDELPAALELASLFLISGFNSMRDAAALDERLAQLRAAMVALPRGAVVFYEDSGFHRPELSVRVRSALLEVIDVYSMNEDELETHLGRTIDLLDPEAVRAALADVAVLIPARALVVHTKYWSAIVGEDAEHYRDALQGGITMASTRYRFGDRFTPGDYAGMSEQTRHPGGVVLATALETAMPGLVCIPAFLLDDPHPTTIGLGDSFVGGFIAALVLGGDRAAVRD
jgi:ADP-dependent phosphofructokinase/glucokinase